MIDSPILRSALAALAIIGTPTVACFGYYSLENLDDVHAALASIVVLAYPTAFLGLMWLFATLSSGRRSRPHLWLASLCLALPTLLLVAIRL
jgi:hypothetical protein